MLRSCYATRMRYPGGPPAGVAVRWYFTDRPPLGLYTRYASRNWDEEGDESIGEHPDVARPWRNGEAPVLLCSAPCGTARHWDGRDADPSCLLPGWLAFDALVGVQVRVEDTSVLVGVEASVEADVVLFDGYQLLAFVEAAVEGIAGFGPNLYPEVLAEVMVVGSTAAGPSVNGQADVQALVEGIVGFGPNLAPEALAEALIDGVVATGQGVPGEALAEALLDGVVATGQGVPGEALAEALLDGVVETTTGEEMFASVSGGRLTLSSVNALADDLAAQGTLYFLPFRSGRVLVPNSGATDLEGKDFTSVNLALSVSVDTNYDIYLWNDSGTLKLQRGTAWGSDTGGADAKTTIKGVTVNNAAIGSMPASRGLYLGVIRGSGSNTVDDSSTKRFLWNSYNREARSLVVESTSSHTYGLGAWRRWNNSTATRLAWVAGEAASLVSLHVHELEENSGMGAGRCNFGLDGSLVPQAGVNAEHDDDALSSHSTGFTFRSGLGYHYADPLESDNSPVGITHEAVTFHGLVFG